MAHDIAAPVLGNMIIISISGVVTVCCFAIMLWMLFRPGETDPRHPKYEILRKDR